ncbi:uncharacterized protein LOC106878954 [Octopus bimaculoides]|uniref:uncharacterized protein LOC106878954 n=1 Tax=Octopus bimaculoides TaxID=37653 RepID=UPI00071C3AFB|nr:uncharacterized protein LOC106878954 [Octopus bimaculoides]|eukprot:XP_014783817.1 PREDICTED: uncharacterized protein LOC106878954 [Octopus bimaculoides]
MTSRGYITVGGGSSWRSSGLPNRLLMSMMLMIMITFSYTQDSIEMTSLTPADGFTIGGGNTMNITCSYNMRNFLKFKVVKNNSTVVEMQYSISNMVFQIVQTRGFDCTFPGTGTSDLVNCWKSNLTCDDVASYTCSTNTVTSSPKSLKVKSSIKNMTRVDSH